jgi:hypothetical protein
MHYHEMRERCLDPLLVSEIQQTVMSNVFPYNVKDYMPMNF